MKVISTKIVDGKKMFLIEEPTKLFAQNGFSSNPYYVPIQGSISDNTKTKLSPKKELSKEEIKQLQKSPTSVKNIKAKEVEDKNQRLKLSEQAYQKRKTTGIQSSQDLANETGAIGDKISLQNIPHIGKYIPNFLDVTGGIGNMASSLGRLPLNLERGNYGMFDMSNPDIYKTIVGGLATGTLGKQTMEKKEFGGKIKVLDTKIENGKKYFLINDIEKNNTFEKGGSVSDIYKQKTGKNWNTAKLEGLTTGSYEDNIKLKNRLLSGEFDNKQVVNSNTINNQDYTKAKNFNEAFKIARQQLGTNQIFEYQGRKYGTNIAGEKFEPSKDVLEKAGMNIPNVKKSLHEQNKLVNSVYSTKKTTKLEPEYQDWEKIRQRQQEINKMNQVDIIKEYHKGSNEQYLVLDKKRGKVHLYQGNKEITSYNVGTGENIGDEQTRTWVEKGTGKVDWSKGNKQTGAGIYTVSGKTSKNAHYSNVPSWNFKNDQGIEVPMAIHASTPGRIGKIQDKDESNNRVSNGCINGLCYDLEDLYKRGYKEGQKLYVLPDDDKNTYEISNGKLIFKSNSSDVNRSVNTLNYKPIQIQYNKYLKENAPEVANMTQAIVNNKQKLMKELKINGDVYNELAKLTLGLAGQESKYGTSFKFKAKTEFTQDILKNITGNKSYNSKGLTQIKYDGVNDEVKKIFKKYNITKENLNQGDKAALAQIILLSHMYNNELPAYRKNIDEVGISDIDALLYLNQGKRKELVDKTATPEKNTYIQSVKKFAEDFKIKQLN